MSIIGKTIVYQYEGADRYRVSFSQTAEGNFAHWHVLSGKHQGENRKESADIAEVAPDVWFVSWLEPTLEVVSFVVNLSAKTITCSYYYDGERHWWQGEVLAVSCTEKTQNQSQ